MLLTKLWLYDDCASKEYLAFSDALIVMDKISFGSKLVLILLCVIASHCTVSDDNVPVEVRRRLGGDIVYVSSTGHFSCDKVNLTFLTSDRKCVKNQELINGNNNNNIAKWVNPQVLN